MGGKTGNDDDTNEALERIKAQFLDYIEKVWTDMRPKAVKDADQ